MQDFPRRTAAFGISTSNRTCAALITGFGPFPGVPNNVSAMLAERIGGAIRQRMPTQRIVTAALPTEWEVAPELVCDLICEHQPAIALHFGVSDQATGFVVETVARNQTGRVDAAGVQPFESEIEPFGPDVLATQLPAARITARLRRLSLPARLSRDAGTYLCNAVFYRSVLTQRESGNGGRSGFVHLPVAIAEPPRVFGRRAHRGWQRVAPLSLDDAVRGGVEIVVACLGR